MTPADVDPILKASFEDFRMSRSERRELQQAVAMFDNPNEAMAYFRNRAFHLVRELDDADVALDWLEEAIKALVPKPKESNPTKIDVAFSPGETCRQMIIRELDNARKQADICVFTITDNEIRDALMRTHNRGISIRIISDNDKSEDRGSDLDYLGAKGIPTAVDRSEHHMHHKYALFDRSRLLTGSYNWTRSAANFNQENIVTLDDEKAVKKFQHHFDDLWQKLSQS